MSHRTKETLPGNQVATSGYDAVGNLIRYTNFNNVVITNQYDALNRLTNKTSIAGYHVSFAYSPTGERTNMMDASGTTSYTYDSRDRLLAKITPEGALTYTYDGFGNVATIQSSTTNGTSLAYSYDLLNRLTNAVDRFTNSTTYNFDAIGNLQTEVLPNSITNIFSYDSLNRLTNLVCNNSSGLTQARFAYQLMKDGTRTNLVEMVNAFNRSYAWSYDPLSRLTNEVITGASPTGIIGYKYDAVGNRTNRTSTVSGVANQTFSYNADDELTADGYDANGSTTNSAGNTYGYDVENRLTNFNNGAASYVYDGDGNRVKKIVSGVTTYYLIDDRNPSGYAQVLEELSTVGSTPTRLYTYGLNLVSQRQSGGTTSLYGYDGNGNARFLIAATGTISDTYTYDAFGDLIASVGSTPNNYLYTGEQYDPNLGFYYLRARYMNPATGRFWTRDSFAGHSQDPQSLHKYLFVKNDPLNLTDPSGNDFDSLLDIDISINLGAIINLANVTVAEVSQSVGSSLEFSPKDTTLGLVQRVLAAEVREPGAAGFDLNDSERGLYGVGAVIVNRVLSPKFPNTIEGVIKQPGQFAGFGNYPTLPAYIENTVSDLQSFANSKGSKVLKYRLHLINLLGVANRVVDLDPELDVFVPAGGPYIPTLFFRTAGSSNPWGGPARQLPEYRDTAGGSDFYTDKQ